MTTTISSREFNQDTARAKRAAQAGPVYVTDRGKPRFVLLTYEAYERLVGGPSIAELLAEPDGLADVDIEFPSVPDVVAPIELD